MGEYEGVREYRRGGEGGRGHLGGGGGKRLSGRQGCQAFGRCLARLSHLLESTSLASPQLDTLLGLSSQSEGRHSPPNIWGKVDSSVKVTEARGPGPYDRYLRSCKVRMKAAPIGHQNNLL